MTKTFDPEIVSYTYKRHLRVRRERFDGIEPDELETLHGSQMYKSLEYFISKLTERFGDAIASRICIQFFEQDADNIVKNLVTIRISFDVIEIKYNAN